MPQKYHQLLSNHIPDVDLNRHARKAGELDLPTEQILDGASVVSRVDQTQKEYLQQGRCTCPRSDSTPADSRYYWAWVWLQERIRGACPQARKPDLYWSRAPRFFHARLTVTSKPFLTRLNAMPRPMMPIPMKPYLGIFLFRVSLCCAMCALVGLLRAGLRARSLRRDGRGHSFVAAPLN